MPTVRNTGNATYLSHDDVTVMPGEEVEVSDEKAEQLLRDFPAEGPENKTTIVGGEDGNEQEVDIEWWGFELVKEKPKK